MMAHSDLLCVPVSRVLTFSPDHGRGKMRATLTSHRREVTHDLLRENVP